jgi:hypothetical protein
LQPIAQWQARQRCAARREHAAVHAHERRVRAHLELEVGAAPAEPTPLYLDAQAVLDGTNCERLAKASRWMAMRYAMLRWGIACGTIAPRKLLTAMNPADGLTKCLTGKPFENGRARLLGLPIPHPGL